MTESIKLTGQWTAEERVVAVSALLNHALAGYKRVGGNRLQEPMTLCLGLLQILEGSAESLQEFTAEVQGILDELHKARHGR